MARTRRAVPRHTDDGRTFELPQNARREGGKPQTYERRFEIGLMPTEVMTDVRGGRLDNQSTALCRRGGPHKRRAKRYTSKQLRRYTAEVHSAD